jgi:hypothetical protein
VGYFFGLSTSKHLAVAFRSLDVVPIIDAHRPTPSRSLVAHQDNTAPKAGFSTGDKGVRTKGLAVKHLLQIAHLGVANSVQGVAQSEALSSATASAHKRRKDQAHPATKLSSTA